MQPPPASAAVSARRGQTGAFAAARTAVGLAGATLALLTVTLAIPWVSISYGALGSLDDNLFFFILGFVLDNCSGSAFFSCHSGGVWLVDVVATPTVDGEPAAFVADTASFYAGLAAGRFEIAYPWRFVAILRALRALPYPLFFRLITRFVLKRS